MTRRGLFSAQCVSVRGESSFFFYFGGMVGNNFLFKTKTNNYIMNLTVINSISC